MILGGTLTLIGTSTNLIVAACWLIDAVVASHSSIFCGLPVLWFWRLCTLGADISEIAKASSHARRASEYVLEAVVEREAVSSV